MNDIIERLFTITNEDIDLSCLCDVIFTHYPDGLIVKVLEINNIDSSNFKKDYVTEVANKLHETIVNEQNDKDYDEGDR